MPGFNGTGPRGIGPMTGRGRGYCMSYVEPGADFTPGLGWGGGRGRRYCYNVSSVPRWAGWRQRFPVQAVYAPPSNNEQEMELYKEQIKNLEDALEQAEKRIKELENKE
ncbi:DUF5320 domain-containing protein [Desulfolucanica intricata]|uniref:DUF5320 domain-containing protein n=1 Tax=Desulfolucanica intricata TaxID=1285191 RepID=UPI0008369E0D|nr:DUF5320 domain-containing protein [Desulfolucanica intricata]